MKQYIDKADIMARIRKLKMDIGNIFNEYDEGFWEGRSTAFDNVICVLDTLEVKEVDKEILENVFPEHKESEGIKTLAHMWADTYRDETSYKIAYNSFLEGAKWHSWAKY